MTVIVGWELPKVKPEKSKRKRLWQDLEEIDPSMDDIEYVWFKKSEMNPVGGKLKDPKEWEKWQKEAENHMEECYMRNIASIHTKLGIQYNYPELFLPYIESGTLNPEENKELYEQAITCIKEKGLELKLP
jgi:hypothetical protein